MALAVLRLSISCPANLVLLLHPGGATSAAQITGRPRLATRQPAPALGSEADFGCAIRPESSNMLRPSPHETALSFEHVIASDAPLREGSHANHLRSARKSALSSAPVRSVILHSRAIASRTTVSRFGSLKPSSMSLTCVCGISDRSATACCVNRSSRPRTHRLHPKLRASVLNGVIVEDAREQRLDVLPALRREVMERVGCVLMDRNGQSTRAHTSGDAACAPSAASMTENGHCSAALYSSSARVMERPERDTFTSMPASMAASIAGRRPAE